MKTLEPQVLQRLLWEIGRNQQEPPGNGGGGGGGRPTPLAENTLLLWADPGVPPAVLLRLAKHELVRWVLTAAHPPPTVLPVQQLPLAPPTRPHISGRPVSQRGSCQTTAHARPTVRATAELGALQAYTASVLATGLAQSVPVSSSPPDRSTGPGCRALRPSLEQNGHPAWQGFTTRVAEGRGQDGCAQTSRGGICAARS